MFLVSFFVPFLLFFFFFCSFIFCICLGMGFALTLLHTQCMHFHFQLYTLEPDMFIMCIFNMCPFVGLYMHCGSVNILNSRNWLFSSQTQNFSPKVLAEFILFQILQWKEKQLTNVNKLIIYFWEDCETWTLFITFIAALLVHAEEKSILGSLSTCYNPLRTALYSANTTLHLALPLHV